MLAFAIISCTTEKNAVSYTEARNYFHNNNAPLPGKLKITTEEEFYRHFSPAALMGKGGEVTPIDFRRSFVIAKAHEISEDGPCRA